LSKIACWAVCRLVMSFLICPRLAASWSTLYRNAVV
jgi:hypothetical protein